MIISFKPGNFKFGQYGSSTLRSLLSQACEHVRKGTEAMDCCIQVLIVIGPQYWPRCHIPRELHGHCRIGSSLESMLMYNDDRRKRSQHVRWKEYPRPDIRRTGQSVCRISGLIVKSDSLFYRHNFLLSRTTETICVFLSCCPLWLLA